jgi:hypothetical protein
MMTGSEAATVRPPQLGFRAIADEARPSRVFGGSSGTREELGVTGLMRQQVEQQCHQRRLAGGGGQLSCSGARGKRKGRIL